MSGVLPDSAPDDAAEDSAAIAGHPARRWLLLIVLSGLFAGGLAFCHLPAAFLIGPMVAAIVVSVVFSPVRLPKLPFDWALAVVGCLIANAVTTRLVEEIFRDWPIFVGGVFAVVVLSLALGWLLAHWQILPGPVAIWGTLPGAASALVVMAGEYGCDVGLVAFTQYVRVIIVSVLAAVVAAIWMPGSAGHSAFSLHGLAEISNPQGFGITIVFVVVISAIARWLRIPAGPMLAAMIAGAVLQDLGWLHIVLPQALLLVGYCLVGWGIGLQFRRETLKRARHALPAVLASTTLLVVACGGLAGLLVWLTGLDPLTAYLATSPGGASSVAVIASESHVDVAYVMAMQIARSWFLIFAGPFLARAVTRWAGFSTASDRAR